MSRGRALVLAGGDLFVDGPQARLLRGPWEQVVCADSGGAHALTLGLRPTLLVGDMDSIDGETRQRLQAAPRATFPTAKDKTDTHLAVERALDQGAAEVVIAGGIGSRFDHSLANALLLALVHRRGAFGVVTDGKQGVYLLTGELVLSGARGQTLSVLPLGPDCRGLSESGVRWDLHAFDPVFGETVTISNEVTADEAVITLDRGTALVVVGPPE